MQPEKILKSDILDILFENRNKEYGAYVLRREYDSRVRNALLYTFSFVALLLLLSFKFNDNKHAIADSPTLTDGKIFTLQNAADSKGPSPAHEQVKKIMHPNAASKMSDQHVIVKDDEVHKRITLAKPTDSTNVVVANNTGTNTKEQSNEPGGKGPGNNVPNTGSTVGGNNDKPDTLVMSPDVDAQFPGGINALQNFLKKNIKRPEDIEDDKTIEVKVRFIVNADGSVTGAQVIESGGNEYDDNVLQTIKRMPGWVPAKFKGRNVAAYFIIPVKFIADEE
jgi:periplasmic protein TonB